MTTASCERRLAMSHKVYTLSWLLQAPDPESVLRRRFSRAGVGHFRHANPAFHPVAASDRSVASVAGMKHFSMIRGFHLADFFTLANAACGALMVFFAAATLGTRSPVHFFSACAMAPAALLFDVLDGRIARWRHQSSPLGRELDSLADVISFGVGPAVLGFAAGLQGGWDLIALIYFVCCGVSRLARYNVTAESLSAGADKVPYFEGT